ncbi:dTDP-4-dehydrorhamnose 3,5-epimerase [Aliidongia dinghuensis]|uniref:dTDP-4-dehydrorhamnose 3,5-epimerase n=1 Tax=Aliidongia dinghuensis TaxID=1867774 RepID=A0A8J3E4U3_9PROT|nr:dTDP-4-dehydrorhamnose 3,5-epimerase [Aliidongia dinghuensis]GGF27108.1 dTDP-4-dehydrorhamnose 3,5-epimerase [Aliidongia dinghuensis]
MEIVDTRLPGVKVVRPKIHGDHRGFFSEIFRSEWLPQVDFIQENLSLSAEVGTIRGLHYQEPPDAQDKLVMVVQGAILDVAVDLRHGSPTFGQWVAVELRAEDLTQMFVPVGFAHGFCTLQPNTMVLYKVSAPYSPARDRGILWDDPDLGIEWPVAPGAAILSDKDRRLPRLKDAEPIFRFGG